MRHALTGILLLASTLGHAGESSDPESRFQRAETYYFGKGVKQDCVKAIALYEKAADAGHGLAAARLGGVHFVGKSCGYKKDLKKAKFWFEKGAAAGDAGSMVNLGFMHNHAMGVPKDYKKALELYRKAADLGDGQAMHNIGYMYRHGQGVPKDPKKAEEWTRKGDPDLKARGLPTSGATP